MPMFRRAFGLAYLGVLTALIVLLAACGGDGGLATSPPTLVPTSTPAATATPAPTATPTPVPQPESRLSASTTKGEAPLEVVFTNLSKNADVFEWDFGDETTASSTSVDESVTHEYTKTGTYQITLRALKEGRSDSASTATVSVTVGPGPLFEVKIEPDALTTSPAQEQVFTVTVLDQFGNEISDFSYVFSADDKAGEVDDTGRFTTGVVAGTYSAAVSLEVAQGSVAKSAAVDITY